MTDRWPSKTKADSQDGTVSRRRTDVRAGRLERACLSVRGARVGSPRICAARQHTQGSARRRPTSQAADGPKKPAAESGRPKEASLGRGRCAETSARDSDAQCVSVPGEAPAGSTLAARLRGRQRGATARRGRALAAVNPYTNAEDTKWTNDTTLPDRRRTTMSTGPARHVLVRAAATRR